MEMSRPRRFLRPCVVHRYGLIISTNAFILRLARDWEVRATLRVTDWKVRATLRVTDWEFRGTLGVTDFTQTG